MKGIIRKYDGELELLYNITPEMKDKICKKLIWYYTKYCHDAEGIHQDDDSIIEAPVVLAEISDNIIKFKELSEEEGR